MIASSGTLAVLSQILKGDTNLTNTGNRYDCEAPMASPVSITRVFNNGNSQAVSIPAEFRLNTDHVQISRNEHGDLVIHPIPVESGQALLQAEDARTEYLVPPRGQLKRRKLIATK